MANVAYRYLLVWLCVPVGEKQIEVNKISKKGWRLVAVSGDLHYFERPLAKPKAQSKVKHDPD